MESPDEWDVEKYKTEHECDEHWELRRQFLLAHKDKFPVDELVCLAQVFTNIEFLGCRYPEETMQLVAELSHEVAADYREKQKSKLQRTFVKASDAAGAKVKGLGAKKQNNNVSTVSTKPVIPINKYRAGIGQQDPSQYQPPSKKIKTNDSLNRKRSQIQNNSMCSGPFGNIVLFEFTMDNPVNSLIHAINVSGQTLEWIFDQTPTECKCEVKINSACLIIGYGTTKKLAKRAAATDGLELLKNYYYTIKTKQVTDNASQSLVSTESITDAAPEENLLPNDNIGRKLMLLMGWSGGGLGKAQQGIVEPVTLKQQITKEGLGLKVGTTNQVVFKKNIYKVLKNYVHNDTTKDLAFACDFSIEERAQIHQVARQLGLKSHSHGPKSTRTLVISRKLDISELLSELKEMGGETGKYQLIPPKKCTNN